MSKRIVLSGYYGFGNTGDEAVLAGILATFREIGLDARVTVLSADPARTTAEHPGVKAVHRYSPAALLRTISSADLVISGGGSLFQDVTSTRSVTYYLTVLQLTRLFRRKAMIYAQGVGPLVAESTRKAVAGEFNKTRLITVRDCDSIELLKSIGVNQQIHLAADPALVIEPNYEKADEIIAASGLSESNIIGVSLRPWPGAEEKLEEAAIGIEAACNEIGTLPALVPMQETEDIDVCKAAGCWRALKGSGQPDVVKGLLGRCGLVVGMRLHALILSAGEGIPCVPVSYDPKVVAFAGSAGMGNVLDIKSLNREQIRAAVVKMWKERDRISGELRVSSARLRELALQAGRLAKSVLV